MENGSSMVSTEALEFVADMAVAAGQVAKQYFGQTSATRKADGSLVTPADQDAERFIREHVQARWPQDGIVGEELLGASDLAAPRVWCVDPIDGTHNFVAGLPLWAVSIGLCEAGQPTLGVVHAPLLNLTFTGAQGQGAFVNGRPLLPSRDAEILPNDLIGFTTEAEETIKLRLPHKSRNLGCGALHACYVAAGVFKGAMFTHWGVWDLAAGLAIAAQVGAVARTLDGQPLENLAHLDPHQHHEPLVLAPVELCDRLVANISQGAE